MKAMYIHTTALDLKKIIQKDKVLETTQTKPNTTFQKNILQWYLIGNKYVHRS